MRCVRRETWESQAKELERCVFAVVGGTYRERIRPGEPLGLEYALTFPDGAASGRSATDPVERLRAAEPFLRRLDETWQSWSLNS
ncbi:DUF6226 family protein [Microbacterium sp.]|nr:DUF6226 family protein [Microbacterium sp.]